MDFGPQGEAEIWLRRTDWTSNHCHVSGTAVDRIQAEGRVFLGFRTHVVATTVCTTESVRTLTSCTHIFLLHSLSAHIRTSSCVCTYTHGSSVCKKGVCICVVSPYLAISCLMSHPSLLFPHGHFETTPDHDFTDDFVDTFLPYLPALKPQDTRNSARTPRSLLPGQIRSQHSTADMNRLMEEKVMKKIVEVHLNRTCRAVEGSMFMSRRECFQHCRTEQAERAEGDQAETFIQTLHEERLKAIRSNDDTS